MPANEVCEGYVFTGVCLSTRGGGVRGCSRGEGHAWLLRGCAWLLPGGMRGCSPGMCVVAPGGHAWLLGGVCGCSGGGACVVALGGACMVAAGGCVVAPGGHAWDTTRYGDTINERAVRILLECILVIA